MSDFEMVSSSFSDHTCSQSSSNGIDPFSKSSEWTGSLVVTVPVGPSLRNDSSEREKLANQLLVVARCCMLNTETLVRDSWQRPQIWTPYLLLPKCWPQSQPPAPPLYPLHLRTLLCDMSVLLWQVPGLEAGRQLGLVRVGDRCRVWGVGLSTRLGRPPHWPWHGMWPVTGLESWLGRLLNQLLCSTGLWTRLGSPPCQLRHGARLGMILWIWLERLSHRPLQGAWLIKRSGRWTGFGALHSRPSAQPLVASLRNKVRSFVLEVPSPVPGLTVSDQGDDEGT